MRIRDVYLKLKADLRAKLSAETGIGRKNQGTTSFQLAPVSLPFQLIHFFCFCMLAFAENVPLTSSAFICPENPERNWSPSVLLSNIWEDTWTGPVLIRCRFWLNQQWGGGPESFRKDLVAPIITWAVVGWEVIGEGAPNTLGTGGVWSWHGDFPQFTKSFFAYHFN